MRIRYVNTFTLFFLSVLIGSCSHTKHLQTSAQPVNDSILKFEEAKLRGIPIKSLIFNNIEGDIDINGKHNSFSCSIKSINDSLLVVSVISVLGVEVVRVFLTDDSVVILDRTKREYEIEGFRNLVKKYSEFLSVKSIKDILIGKIVIDFSALNFVQLQKGNDYYKFGVVYSTYVNGEKKEAVVNYILNSFGLKPAEFSWKSGSINFDVVYDEYRFWKQFLFPAKLSLKAGNKEMEIVLNLSIGNLKEIENPNTHIIIPDGYKKKI